jgi:SAM-dependent methyltransferase
MAELEHVACPLCASSSGFIDVRVPSRDDHIRGYGELYAGVAKSRWKICARCGFVHQNPRPSIVALDRYYLAGNYHTRVDEPPEAILASHVPGYVDEIDFAIVTSGIRTGRVLDIGCGLGVALQLFRERGWDVVGVEPDAGRVEYAHRHFGLDMIRHGTFDRTFALDGQVDLVFTHHAFEHFADLTEVMLGIARVLRPGGHVFTAIPTYRHNRSTMSKQWMNSAHYSLFTHRSLGQMFARHGFEPVAHRYDRWANPDQLGHVARLLPAGSASPAVESFFEDPHEVARYLAVVNPLRSAVFVPLRGGYYGYAHHVGKLARLARAAADVLVRHPEQFLPRAAAYLRERLR